MFFSFSFLTDDVEGLATATAAEEDVDDTEDTFLEGALTTAAGAGLPLATGRVSSSTALDSVACPKKKRNRKIYG